MHYCPGWDPFLREPCAWVYGELGANADPIEYAGGFGLQRNCHFQYAHRPRPAIGSIRPGL